MDYAVDVHKQLNPDKPDPEGDTISYVYVQITSATDLELLHNYIHTQLSIILSYLCFATRNQTASLGILW